MGKGADSNEKDRNGGSPLRRAVRFRNPKVVEFLVENGADVNGVDKRNGLNSGAPSTKGKSEEAVQIVKTLLQNGVDPHLKNKKGKTPLDYVKKEAVKELFENHDTV